MEFNIELDNQLLPKGLEKNQILTINSESSIIISVLNHYLKDYVDNILCKTFIYLSNYEFDIIPICESNKTSFLTYFKIQGDKLRKGPNKFFFKSTNSNIYSEEFYIQVEPDIIIKDNKISINGINLQSIISKSIGKINEWEKYFMEASFLGYNFVHFTPIQQTGMSNSLYSISNHNKINDFFGDHSNIRDVLSKARDEYGIKTVVDIVANHISNSSDWLKNNAEACFNLNNTPNLIVAYELEKLLLIYQKNFINKQCKLSFAPYIRNENDLNDLLKDIKIDILENKFEEYFKLNINDVINSIMKYLLQSEEYISSNSKKNSMIFKTEEEFLSTLRKTIRNQGHGRFKTNIVLESFVEQVFIYKNIKFTSFSKLDDKEKEEIETILKFYLLQLNIKISKEYDSLLSETIKNIYHFIKYRFLELNNHKADEINTIITKYFTVLDESNYNLIFANNGWIYGNNDPTINFTSSEYNYYFIRGIICWGDCVKFNYFGHENIGEYEKHVINFKGNNYYPSKSLIDYMLCYVRNMAEIFDGFRLDNCHSTPIFILELLMNESRKINPNLLVMAELFAGDEKREISFVNKGGINLLIRECIHSLDLESIGREIHYYGGGFENIFGKFSNNTSLIGRKPYSIIYDISHDNKTLFSILGNGKLFHTFVSLISFGLSAIGTTRGFDEFYLFNPSVVKEERKYRMLDIEKIKKIKYDNVNWETMSFSSYKTNDYTFELDKCNVKESADLFLSIDWLKKYSFKIDKNNSCDKISLTIDNLDIKSSFQIEYKYLLDHKHWYINKDNPIDWDINGNINNVLDIQCAFKTLFVLRKYLNNLRVKFTESCQMYIHNQPNLDCINIFIYDSYNMSGYYIFHRTSNKNTCDKPIDISVNIPGEIVKSLFASYLRKADKGMNSNNKIKYLENDIYCDLENDLLHSELLGGSNVDFRFTTEDSFLKNKFKLESKKSNMSQNQDDIIHFNNIPQNFTMCFKYSLTNVQIDGQRKIQELLKVDNFIDGINILQLNYLLFSCDSEELSRTSYRGTYTIPNYLKLCFSGFESLFIEFKKLRNSQNIGHQICENIRQGDWLLKYHIERVSIKGFENLQKYLTDFLSFYQIQPKFLKPSLFDNLIQHLENVTNCKLQILNEGLSDHFIFYLRKASIQFIGNINNPINLEITNNDSISISAGLPHFSSGFMRSWGRDTFISFYGLLLVNRLYIESKYVLISYANTVKHGLIPNLFDNGKNPRYNARDATWFFMKSIIDYYDHTNDITIFSEKLNNGTMIDIIYSILKSHLKGINFREENAGKTIDENMRSEGFDISIYVDLNNGFIYGGNKFNCGTWMDKMGSVENFNKGIPSTPRYGSNVEIISILYKCLNFYDKLFKETDNNLWRDYSEIKLDKMTIKLSDWADLIKLNFEKEFFIQKEFTIKNEEYSKLSKKEQILINEGYYDCDLINSKEFDFESNVESEVKDFDVDSDFYLNLRVNKISDYLYSQDYLTQIVDKNKNISTHSLKSGKHQLMKTFKLCYYRDTLSTNTYENVNYGNEIRPNFIIALAVSPELFDLKNAIKSIKTFEHLLLNDNCMGVRTLSRLDLNYNGNYYVNDHTHGHNYHNGPEWLWPLGYYFLAKKNVLYMILKDKQKVKNEMMNLINEKLIPHYNHLMSSNWRSLPELTNENGTECYSSCPSQAWSVATLLEAIEQIVQ